VGFEECYIEVVLRPYHRKKADIFIPPEMMREMVSADDHLGARMGEWSWIQRHNYHMIREG
jgi:hypothetical protein